MKIIAGLLATLLFIGGAYYFFSPTLVMQRKTEAALTEFSSAIATKDRAQIGAALQKFLSGDAQVHLEIKFFSITQMDGGTPMVQDFDKPAFIGFIDNVIYPLKDYGYEAELQNFVLAPDRARAVVTFTSREWADSTSYAAGTPITLRFSSSTACDGQVSFVGDAPALSQAACKIDMRSVPKAGQEDKLRSPEALRQLLR